MLKPGAIVGDYIVSKQLGSGRFSSVFAGISLDGQERRVAIKLLTDRMDNPTFKATFDVEVMALKTLSHENIVSILDSGTTDDGFPYLITEICDAPLQAIGKWDKSAVELAKTLLSAIQQAHAFGVIHRDIKRHHILYVDSARTIGPKIVDFGIAKIRKNIGSGVTLASYYTPGYACDDQIAGKDAKPCFDLYAVAACMVWYLTSRDPAPEEPLAAQISRLDSSIPEQFRNFLAVLARTDNTALTAGAALRTLEELSAKWVDAPPCYLEVHSDTIKDLATALGISQDNVVGVLQAIEDDLEAVNNRFPVLAVQEKRTDPVAALSYNYRLIGSDYIWRLAPRPAGRSFVLTRFEKPSPIDLEGQRLSGVEIPLLWTVKRYTEGAPVDGTPILPICEMVVKAEVVRQKEKAKSESRVKLVETWENVFQLQRWVLGAPDRAVTYRGWIARDELIQVTLTSGQTVPAAWTAGQRLAMTRMDGGVASAGILVRVAEDNLTLTPTLATKLENIAPVGEVREDRGLEYAALDRQQKALAAIRQGRACNPDLPDIICGTREPLPGTEVVVPDWYHPSLDQPKRNAVTKALGCQDILLIQGPPGTGKTVAIAELVLQILRREAKSRILLVSQSHVAVDQAIERITKVDPKVSLVRLGRNEDKVAPGVKPWQLQGRVDVWRSEVLKRSREYLAGLGLDPAAAARVSSIQDLLSEIEMYDKKIKEWTSARMAPLSSLSRLTRRPESGNGDDRNDEEDVRAEIELIDEELRSLREDRKAAVDLAQESFALHGISVEGEPSSWKEHVALFGAASSLGPEQLDLVGLWDSWRRQFGRGLPYQAALAKRSRVLCGTCLGTAAHPAVDRGEFGWVIVDEAGRATPPELLVPLVRGKRAILVGDHLQLPPVVDHDLPESELDNLGLTRSELEMSLFQLLHEELPETHRLILDQQYRMHPSISRLISEVFYNGQLRDGEREQEPLSQLSWPIRAVTWMSTSSLQDHRESPEGTSFRNDCEVRVARTILETWLQVVRELRLPMSVGIIAGYGAQKTALERELDPENEARWAPLRVEVNTVDAFQGRETDVIIYSAVRSNLRGEIGFLADLRRLNVALSRARQRLVIIGDAGMLRYGMGPMGLNPFRKVLDWIQEHHEHAMIEEISP